MLLAALASRSSSLGSLGALASGLLGGHSSTALFVDLLRSSTISGHLIDRFDLQHVYHKRYRVDTAKRLARCTTITDDKKSGVITIEVRDHSPTRARDLAQAYLDELNKLMTATSTSAARRERVFIEARLATVQRDLEQAQVELSDFSSRNNAVDIKEQTRAMVDAGARVEGELLVAQSGLQALRQIYGDENVRVRETKARIATLKQEIANMAGSPSSTDQAAADSESDLYPQLRQIPRLAVPYADLYRRVKVQETVYELLTQQYELARIEEAKDIPVVGVIDPPGVPEKKSFPPRALLTLLLTSVSTGIACIVLLCRDRWSRVDARDPLRVLVEDIAEVIRLRMATLRGSDRGAA